MQSTRLTLALTIAVLTTGCATITGDTVQSIRVETRTADGTEIRDADCELSNEYGSVRLRTPGNVTIRRSSSDLNVLCSKAEQLPAHGRGVSRANAGMWGNIIFGGGIGAIIDHSKGTAYTYPQWMQMTFGKVLTFDRGDDKDGQPSVARETATQQPQPTAQNNASPQATSGSQPVTQQGNPAGNKL